MHGGPPKFRINFRHYFFRAAISYGGGWCVVCQRSNCPFFLRAGCDTLPTPMNLACMVEHNFKPSMFTLSSQPTTNHILTGCFTALDQGRYTYLAPWFCFTSFVDGLKKDLPSCYTLYADLPGYLATTSPPSTVPPNISSTSSRSDMGLVSNNYC